MDKNDMRIDHDMENDTDVDKKSSSWSQTETRNTNMLPPSSHTRSASASLTKEKDNTQEKFLQFLTPSIQTAQAQPSTNNINGDISLVKFGSSSVRQNSNRSNANDIITEKANARYYETRRGSVENSEDRIASPSEQMMKNPFFGKGIQPNLRQNSVSNDRPISSLKVMVTAPTDTPRSQSSPLNMESSNTANKYRGPSFLDLNGAEINNNKPISPSISENYTLASPIPGSNKSPRLSGNSDNSGGFFRAKSSTLGDHSKDPYVSPPNRSPVSSYLDVVNVQSRDRSSSSPASTRQNEASHHAKTNSQEHLSISQNLSQNGSHHAKTNSQEHLSISQNLSQSANKRNKSISNSGVKNSPTTEPLAAPVSMLRKRSMTGEADIKFKRRDSEMESVSSYSTSALEASRDISKVVVDAKCFLEGLRGFPKNPPRAFTLFEYAANSGDVTGMHHLAWCYQYGVGTEKKNIEKAIKIYQIACDMGNASSAFCLHKIYSQGRGVPRDEMKAFGYCTKAYMLNPFLSEAIDTLARYYMEGKAVVRDVKKAVELFTIAAENPLNYTKSIVGLGQCYFEGIGVEANPQAAYKLFKRAFELGDYAFAAERLGCCYFTGAGVEQNIFGGLYYTEMADINHVELPVQTLTLLGSLFDEGAQIPKDKIKSMYYLTKAANLGDNYAKELLEKFRQEALEGKLLN